MNMSGTLVVFILCVGIGSFCAHPTEIVADDVKERSALTSSQREKLEKFREVVADILEDDYERSDEYLLGYLLSKQCKLFSAEQMLRIAKDWKKTHNFEELSKSNFSSEMLQRFPLRVENYDKNGCPLTEFDFGKWNMADYILNQEFLRDGVTNLIKYHWQLLAKEELRNRNSFPKCHQTRLIVSMKNYNSSHISEINSISATVRMLTDFANNFPSALLKCQIIDVPDSAMPIIELIRSTVNDEINKKVKIYAGDSEDWRKDLDALIDRDQRTMLYGGTL